MTWDQFTGGRGQQLADGEPGVGSHQLRDCPPLLQRRESRFSCSSRITTTLFQNENEMHLAPEDTCFPLDGELHQHLMGLRIWILRQAADHPPHKLKYVDFTPRKDDDDPHSRFRKLDAVLERVNREIQSGLFSSDARVLFLSHWSTGACDRNMGDIVTIETLYYPVSTSDWTVDQRNSVNLFPSRCVCLLRIFYIHSPVVVTKFPIIGIKDFVPKQISGGGFFKMPGK